MTQDTQNAFAAILAKAQLDASKKTVLKSAQVKPIAPAQIEVIPVVITETVKDIDSRPELSTVTFNDIIKEVAPIVQPIEQSLTIVDYSEKAIAVIGNTKPVKEKLKSLGGRWNAHLKCGPGWIFSKQKLALVKSNFNL
jgi:hypothetical protein